METLVQQRTKVLEDLLQSFMRTQGPNVQQQRTGSAVTTVAPSPPARFQDSVVMRPPPVDASGSFVGRGGRGGGRGTRGRGAGSRVKRETPKKVGAKKRSPVHEEIEDSSTD